MLHKLLRRPNDIVLMFIESYLVFYIGIQGSNISLEELVLNHTRLGSCLYLSPLSVNLKWLICFSFGRENSCVKNTEYRISASAQK